MKKRLWKFLLGTAVFIVMLNGLSVRTRALTTKEKLEIAQQQKKDTEGKLSKTKENLSGLQNEQKSLKGTLNNLNDRLTEVGDNLADLESRIDQKQTEIEETTRNLEDAIRVADDQYAAMKKRVQYMYEMSDFGLVDVFLKVGSFADMLNYVEYVEALSDYDRKMLVSFRETRDRVKEEKEKLEQENEELEQYKVEVQAEQARVSGLVSSTANSIAKYSNQISEVEAQAEAIENEIKQQEADIAALKKKLAEEMAMSQRAKNAVWRNISEVNFAEGDRALLANLIYCEAGAEPYDGKLAVGAVVVNRVLSSIYPDTVTGVIYQRAQFSPVTSGRLAIALSENRANAACYQAADEAMSGASNVGNCVYFRTPVEGLSGIQIGGHVFY